jgi:hypothetical protein
LDDLDQVAVWIAENSDVEAFMCNWGIRKIHGVCLSLLIIVGGECAGLNQGASWKASGQGSSGRCLAEDDLEPANRIHRGRFQRGRDFDSRRLSVIASKLRPGGATGEAFVGIA